MAYIGSVEVYYSKKVGNNDWQELLNLDDPIDRAAFREFVEDGIVELHIQNFFEEHEEYNEVNTGRIQYEVEDPDVIIDILSNERYGGDQGIQIPEFTKRIGEIDYKVSFGRLIFEVIPNNNGNNRNNGNNPNNGNNNVMNAPVAPNAPVEENNGPVAAVGGGRRRRRHVTRRRQRTYRKKQRKSTHKRKIYRRRK